MSPLPAFDPNLPTVVVRRDEAGNVSAVFVDRPMNVRVFDEDTRGLPEEGPDSAFVVHAGHHVMEGLVDPEVSVETLAPCVLASLVQAMDEHAHPE